MAGLLFPFEPKAAFGLRSTWTLAYCKKRASRIPQWENWFLVSVTRQLTDSCQLIVIMIMVLRKVLIPPRSTDLNPVEKFWSWLRRKLRAMDLKDAVATPPVLGKMAYKRRLRSVCSSQQAQQVAKACARGFRKVCQEVVRNTGAATRG